MSDSLLPNASVLFSEAFLALFPQVIKQNELATIQLQTAIRVLTISGAAWIYVRMYEKQKTFLNVSLKSGFVNTIHIISSYTAFQNMDSSDALTIFYSYPIWNILLARFLLNDEINVGRLPIVGLSLAGVLLVLEPSLAKSPKQITGIIAALIAALTESYLYTTFHDKQIEETPSERLLGQYVGTIPFVLAWVLISQQWFAKNTPNDQQKTLVVQIFIFNLIIGFGMHLLRAYGARYARPESFAVLSTAGVFFGFLFQVLFEKKTPSVPKIIGGLLIVVGGVITSYLDYMDDTIEKTSDDTVSPV
jgi:drug/metabolite transporter (DMT)-like permease